MFLSRFQQQLQQQTAGTALAMALLISPMAYAQVLDDNLDTVTGTGGGVFLVGPGFEQIDAYDTGLSNENAFAGTSGNASFGSASAEGLTSGGVGGSGAVSINISNILFDLINEDFESATGTGESMFLTGDGNPNLAGFTLGWDIGLEGERAFGTTFNGAVLNGSITARAITSGGIPGSAGSIDVIDVDPIGGGWSAGLEFSVGVLPGIQALQDASFEALGTGWTTFGNFFLNDGPQNQGVTPLTGANAAKSFGTFSGPSGAYQEIPVEPNQVVTFSAFALTTSGDSIGGTANQAQLRIEWRDASGIIQDPNGADLLEIAVFIDPNAESCNSTDTFDPNFAEDVWVPGIVSGTVPAGATTARCILWFEQPSGCFEGGAVWWDDAALSVSPNTGDLSNYSLAANVRGTANAAGENLGTIQLRLEDSDGNRLFKNLTADGNWQSITGSLDTYSEADSSGTPAAGVFNPSSSSFNIVVAFEDAAASWNGGGTIDVDNVVLGNSNTGGSDWFAGLFFDSIQIPTFDPNALTILDSSKLVLLADVKGSKAAPYSLRLEATEIVVSDPNFTFGSVTGDCGFLSDPNDPNVIDCFLLDALAGETTDNIPNFDSGLSGISAFAGISGGVFPTFTDPGVFVEGDPSGGEFADGSIVITVQGLTLASDGSWFAGVSIPSLALADNDLSNVELRARLKGTAAPFGGLGDILFRLEDGEGDRLQFTQTANGSWQDIGGFLNTATELPAADNMGDGKFDLDDGSYTIVVVFEQGSQNDGASSTWALGGIVEIDSIFLTPATSRNELGRYEFAQSGNTSFETVGGFINAADSVTFSTRNRPAGLNVIDMEDGTPNGPIDMGGDVSFDGTIPNDASFEGGTLSAQIETCASCGVNDSQAVRVMIDQNSNSWFTGFYFEEIPLDLSAAAGSGDPNDLSGSLTAMVNAAGSILPYGVITLRIEDAQTDFIGYDVTTDGTWQLAGGALSLATLGCADPGQCNNVFDYSQETYTITIAITNFTTPQWGGMLTLVADDITYTSDADALISPLPDSFTVTAAFEDEIAAWGTDGELSVDNVFLAVVPNCVADESLDMRDLAEAQICPKVSDCDCADLDGDGDADGADNIPDAFELLPMSLILP